MHPVLFTLELGGVGRPIGSYGVALSMAIVFGGLLLIRGVQRARMDVGGAIAALGGGVLGGFGGGYLMSVLVTALRTGELSRALESGGLVFYGGLFGGLLGCSVTARLMGMPVARLLDLCPVPLAVAHAVGRMGCFLGGCCYGATISGPAGTSAATWPPAVVFLDPLAPAAVSSLPRHPVQLYEACALLALGLAFCLPWPTRREGDRIAWYGLAYGVVRLVLEGLRADPERGQVLGASTSQVIALLSIAGCGLWLRRGFVSAATARYTRSVSGSPIRMLVILLSAGLVTAATFSHAVRPAAAEDTARVALRLSPRIRINAGNFEMGSDADSIDAAVALCAEDPLLAKGCRPGLFSDELPRHAVHVGSYAIDRVEVANAAYRRCVSAHACTPARVEAGDVRLGQPRQPVSGVTWHQAARYCAFAGGRLPSEAEWERAARAGSPRLFPWGHMWNPSLANFGSADGKPEPLDGYRYAAPVDAFADGRSAYGLLNMAGNVWEWTADRYSADYYDRSPEVDPQGPRDGAQRVIRGGSWSSPPHTHRASQRRKLSPDESLPDVGFRCVYDLHRR